MCKSEIIRKILCEEIKLNNSTNPSERVYLKDSRFNLKPSEIMDWSSANVTQVRFVIGNTEKMQGCALGATRLCLSNGLGHKYSVLEKRNPELAKKIREYQDDHYGALILAFLLNDLVGLKFKTIAKILRCFNN